MMAPAPALHETHPQIVKRLKRADGHLRGVTGWAGAALGLPATSCLLAALATVAIGIGFAVWPDSDPESIEHSHQDLPAEHSHLAGIGAGHHHAHDYVIDDLHLDWPRGI